MGLEKLIAPITAMDEEILRQYTVFAEKLESKKIKPEYAAILGSLLGTAAMPMVAFVEYCANIDALRRGKDVTTEITTAPNFLRYVIDKSATIFRFPTLAISGILMAAGSVELFEGIINHHADFRDYGLGYLVYSSSVMGLATSMYLRTRDPKLLDKKPLLDRVVDYVTDTVALPKPASPVINVKSYPHPNTFL
ncbi:MAG: hypothetical protein Q8R37_05090 [Nanoarchaeota archaeon]|nr:hypothetical protein [Nanoarchaeota archaeon]